MARDGKYSGDHFECNWKAVFLETPTLALAGIRQ